MSKPDNAGSVSLAEIPPRPVALGPLLADVPASPVTALEIGNIEPEPAPEPLNRLRALAAGQRPQERALALGVGALADAELLALIIRSGTRGHDVMTLANRLLSEAGSLHALIRWRPADFRRLKGLGRIKALQLCTVMEVARRVLGAEWERPPVLNEPADIYAYLRPRALGLDVEKSWVLVLNTRNRLLRCVELTSGTSRQTLIRPVEVLREAVREGATAFVLAHNHPSGDPGPSAADVRITRQLREAAVQVDLYFHDHLVVGDPAIDPLGLGYYSFRAGGHL
jgi:DNA repair protein RadC